MKKGLLLFFYFAVFWQFFGQNQKVFSVKKKKTISPKEIKQDFYVNLYNLEEPLPNGESYRSFLFRQKQKSKVYHKNILSVKKQAYNKSANLITTGVDFDLVRHANNGNTYQMYGGIPNDNTIAVSKGGLVVSSINSFVYAYDLNIDTTMFPNQRISLSQFSDGVSGGHYFDPKVIYDPLADRFILALLKNSTPETNSVILCFSTTNNPNDPWNVYHLPGNPLDNDRWTDFPAIAITKDKLYFTGNLIVPDEPWQTGFDGSIIWEVPTADGYDGADSLSPKLYHDIKHNGSYIRNLHAVQGAEGIADKMYFLSNRNFDITNDSIFVLDIEETPDSNVLNVNVYQSNTSYGVPPNARQQDTDTSDVTSGLQTNDARVLGAIKMNDEIQFVGNTINPETGFCGVYHGVVSSLSEAPVITGNIIGDSVKDYGYPNIASSGNEACDKEVIIGFNYSSFTDFPGMAAVYCDNSLAYSDVVTLKEGENYVNRLNGTYERWGDYYGLQKMYHKPGSVMAFGFVAKANNQNTGYAVELISPDTSSLIVDFNIDDVLGLCDQTVKLNIEGGVLPYIISWDNEEGESTKHGICVGDTLNVVVSDARGCQKDLEIVVPSAKNESDILIYPNPSSNWVALQFELESESHIEAFLYDDKGALVTVLMERNGKSGTSELVFSIESLSVGNYVLVLNVDGELYKSSNIIKN